MEFIYYERQIKRDLKGIHICVCRYKERLKPKTDGSGEDTRGEGRGEGVDPTLLSYIHTYMHLCASVCARGAWQGCGQYMVPQESEKKIGSVTRERKKESKE